MQKAQTLFGWSQRQEPEKREGGEGRHFSLSASRSSVTERKRRTGVDGRQILKGRKQEHRDDAHAEDLHAAAGHVEHERLHRQRLERGDGKVPSLSLLQRLVRAQRFRR